MVLCLRLNTAGNCRIDVLPDASVSPPPEGISWNAVRDVVEAVLDVCTRNAQIQAHGGQGLTSMLTTLPCRNSLDVAIEIEFFADVDTRQRRDACNGARSKPVFRR